MRVKLIFTGKVSGVPILKRRKGQPRSQGLSSYRPIDRARREAGGKMRDPGNEFEERVAAFCNCFIL